MDRVETVSVLAGSSILLGMLVSIAYEGVKAKSNSKQKVSVLNDKWQKLTVSAR